MHFTQKIAVGLIFDAYVNILSGGLCWLLFLHGSYLCYLVFQQKALKEKEEHVEQLLRERDLERSEVARAAAQVDKVCRKSEQSSCLRIITFLLSPDYCRFFSLYTVIISFVRVNSDLCSIFFRDISSQQNVLH